MLDDPNATMLTIAAKDPELQDSRSEVGRMALMSVAGSIPYAYDPETGSISLTVKEALKGTFQRALVWATDLKVGQAIEASWTFRLPDEQLPIRPVGDPRMIVPAALTHHPLTASAARSADGSQRKNSGSSSKAWPIPSRRWCASARDGSRRRSWPRRALARSARLISAHRER